MYFCPICSSASSISLRAYRSRSSFLSESVLLKCNDCSMVYAAPPPSQQELDKYISSYFLNAHSCHSFSKQQLDFLEAIAQVRVKHVKRYIKFHEINVDSVFEVGPGRGYFAKHWLNDFPETIYNAYEVDSSCHNSLLSFGVNLVTPSDFGSTDLVILSHVLEHVIDPLSFLELSCKALRPGGVIFIEVPCNDWMHKSVDEPHLLFFQKQSLLKLLSQFGFVNINLSYHGRGIQELVQQSNLPYIFDKFNAEIIRKFPIYSQLFRLSGLSLRDSQQIAAILPLRPHVESKKPSWWLRALAQVPDDC